MIETLILAMALTRGPTHQYPTDGRFLRWQPVPEAAYYLFERQPPISTAWLKFRQVYPVDACDQYGCSLFIDGEKDWLYRGKACDNTGRCGRWNVEPNIQCIAPEVYEGGGCPGWWMRDATGDCHRDDDCP